jgi:hypothetical protein
MLTTKLVGTLKEWNQQAAIAGRFEDLQSAFVRRGQVQKVLVILSNLDNHFNQHRHYCCCCDYDKLIRALRRSTATPVGLVSVGEGHTKRWTDRELEYLSNFAHSERAANAILAFAKSSSKKKVKSKFKLSKSGLGMFVRTAAKRAAYCSRCRPVTTKGFCRLLRLEKLIT